MKGIIILGHGSRDKEAQQQFKEVVEQVGKGMDSMVEGAFMELAEPGFFQVVDLFKEKGIKEIVVYPLFLFPGVHIKRDIPEMLKEAEEKYEEIDFSMMEPIGPRKELIDIVVNSIKE